MASFDYASLKSTAERLISTFGQDAEIKSPGSTTGDAWAPSRIKSDPVAIKLVNIDAVRRDQEGTLIKVEELEVLISTSAGVTPTTEDLIKLGSKWHKVLSVNTLNPGGTALLHTVMLER